MKCSAIIVAAGEGRRIGGRKPFMELGGRPLIRWTLKVFLDSPDISDIVLVIHHEDRGRCGELIEASGCPVSIVAGGKERQDSVYEGLKALNSSTDTVVVHDGARPFVTPEIIHSVVNKSWREEMGVLVALPVQDTIKRIVNGRVMETLPRRLIWMVQTPQAFPTEMLFRAYELAMKDGFYSTDDAALCERLGYPVGMVEGDPENIKITTPADFLLAEMILRSRGYEAGGNGK